MKIPASSAITVSNYDPSLEYIATPRVTHSDYLVGTVADNNNNTLNFNYMTTPDQAKVAIFKVKRNKQGLIIKSTFVSEMWVELKPNISLELQVAKTLPADFDPEEIVIKTINTVTF